VLAIIAKICTTGVPLAVIDAAPSDNSLSPRALERPASPNYDFAAPRLRGLRSHRPGQ
jgi:hypothetical protein